MGVKVKMREKVLIVRLDWKSKGFDLKEPKKHFHVFIAFKFSWILKDLNSFLNYFIQSINLMIMRKFVNIRLQLLRTRHKLKT